eukprot:TRINITY_DN4019_c0_g2_i1.p1 TRINITY_DN4019_c0_g2~~TRINITY_DN4019_c0_g2_i1.p1  ORF type:complete len:463 (-),score=46.42 TRINITY_DN4019_c0_g2_i1:32-1219(-)
MMVGGANSCRLLTIFGLLESTCCNVLLPATRTFRTVSLLLCFHLVVGMGVHVRGQMPCLAFIVAPAAFLFHCVDWYFAAKGHFEVTSAAVCQLNEIVRKWRGVYDLIPRVATSLILVAALFVYVDTRRAISRFPSKAVLKGILNRTSSYIVVAVVCLTPYIAMDGDHVAEWTTSLIRGVVFLLFNLTGMIHALLYFMHRSAIQEMYRNAQREHSRRIHRAHRIRGSSSHTSTQSSRSSISRSSTSSGGGGRDTADLDMEGEFLTRLQNLGETSNSVASEHSASACSGSGHLSWHPHTTVETIMESSAADSSTCGTSEWEARESIESEMASWDCSTAEEQWVLEQERQQMIAAQRREVIERWRQSGSNWFTRQIRLPWTQRATQPASPRSTSPRPS